MGRDDLCLPARFGLIQSGFVIADAPPLLSLSSAVAVREPKRKTTMAQDGDGESDMIKLVR